MVMNGCWVTLVILILYHVTCVTSWMDAPYNNQQFNQRVGYGENVTLQCMDHRLPAMGANTFQYWILPDLTVMRSGDTLDFSTFDGQSSWIVSSNGEELRATNLNKRQFGFYYCVVKGDDSETTVVKKAINYNGPFFGSRWPHYRMNVIIGLSSAAVFIVLAIIFVIIVNVFGAKVPEKLTNQSSSGVSEDYNGDGRSGQLGHFMGMKRRDVNSESIELQKYDEIRL